jgi:hypothetical protein
MAGEQSAAAWPQSRAIGRSDQGDLVDGPLLRPGGIGHSLRTSPCSSWPRSIVRISRDCPRRRAPARDRVAQFLWRSRRDRRVWLGRPKPVRDRSGRGTPRFILTLMDTAYRRKCVHIASTTSFSGGRAWFRTICPWGWRPEIARFGFSCSSTAISALADQSTS